MLTVLPRPPEEASVLKNLEAVLIAINGGGLPPVKAPVVH